MGLLHILELAKTTLLVLYPVFVVLWLLSLRPPLHNKDIRRFLTHDMKNFAWIVALSLLVINGGYWFEGSFTRLGEFNFQSCALTGKADLHAEPRTGNRFADSPLAGVPIPLPKNYVQGIDTQRVDFEQTLRSYLRGEWRNGGWWYFYLYALAIKTPMAIICLTVLAIAATVAYRGYFRCWRSEFTLLLPAIAIFTLVSSQTGFSIHLRYVLPALPFVFIWISKVGRSFELGHSHLSFATTCLLASTLASSLFIYPHSLSYFNLLAGGPQRGYHHLVDSSIAWGQDMYYLQDWIDQHPDAHPLNLATFGFVDPELLGIEYRQTTGEGLSHQNRADANCPDGWYAVDVNHLVGSAEPLPGGAEPLVQTDQGGVSLTFFEPLEPVSHVGYSLRVYRLGPRRSAAMELEPRPAGIRSGPGAWLRRASKFVRAD